MHSSQSPYITPPSKKSYVERYQDRLNQSFPLHTTQYEEERIDLSEFDNIQRNMSFSSLSEHSDDIKPIHRRNSHDKHPYEVQSPSSDFTEKHLQVWNKFFDNALRSAHKPKLNSHSSEKSKKISNKKIINNKKLLSFQSKMTPGRTPRSLWPAPMKDEEYYEFLHDFFSDFNRIEDDEWLASVMIAAARKGDAISIAKLLSFEHALIAVSCKDEYMRTPAHYCAKNDDATCLGVLYDNGAECDQSDVDGRTPLHVCCVFGSFEVLQFLLGCAMNVHVFDSSMNTPLHLAARGGYPRFCSLLLEYGADPNARNDQNQTPYDVVRLIEPRTEAHDEVKRILFKVTTYSESKRSNKHDSQAFYNSTLRQRYSISGSDKVVTTSSVISISSDDESFKMPTYHSQPKRQIVRKKEHFNKDTFNRLNYDYEENVFSDEDLSVKARKRLTEAKQAAFYHIQRDHLEVNNRTDSSGYNSRINQHVQNTLEAESSPHPPWLNLRIDTSVGKQHTNTIPVDQAEQYDYKDSISNKSDSEFHKGNDHLQVSDDEDDIEDEGILGRISNIVWGVTGILLDLTVSMFATPSEVTQKDIYAKPSLFSGRLKKKVPPSDPNSDLSFESRDAPPTDQELRSLGLGQHLQPPNIVAAEVLAGVEAIRTGRTPKREYPLQPPPEIEKAINQMKYDRNSSWSENQVISVDKESLPRSLFDYSQSRPVNDAQSLHCSDGVSHSVPPIPSLPDNKYSMGKSLPKGVAWRYVDVINNPEMMK